MFLSARNSLKPLVYRIGVFKHDVQTGRFINSDDLSELDPKTLNGLNLYIYCNDNPVMRTDETGRGFWDWFKWVLVGIVAVIAVAAIIVGTVFTGGALAAVIAGAGIGALTGGGIGAANAAFNGTDIAVGFLGGAMTGAALGAAAPLSAFGALGFGIAVGTSFAAGMLSYTADTLGNNKEFHVGQMFASGAVTAVEGALAFGIGKLLDWAMPGKGMDSFANKYLNRAISGQLTCILDLISMVVMGNKPSKADVWVKFFGGWVY